MKTMTKSRMRPLRRLLMHLRLKGRMPKKRKTALKNMMKRARKLMMDRVKR